MSRRDESLYYDSEASTQVDSRDQSPGLRPDDSTEYGSEDDYNEEVPEGVEYLHSRYNERYPRRGAQDPSPQLQDYDSDEERPAYRPAYDSPDEGFDDEYYDEDREWSPPRHERAVRHRSPSPPFDRQNDDYNDDDGEFDNRGRTMDRWGGRGRHPSGSTATPSPSQMMSRSPSPYSDDSEDDFYGRRR